jgi:hypothetical protein
VKKYIDDFCLNKEKMKSIILVVVFACYMGSSKADFISDVFGLVGGSASGVLGVTCGALDSYSSWSNCYMPSDPATLITTFLTDVAGKDCKTPPQEYVNEAVAAITAENIPSYPLFNRIPTTGTCGSCARRAKCCKPLLSATSFLTQSWKSEVCGSSAPCVVDEISDADKVALQQIQPNVVFDGNRCNFNQYTDDLLSKVAADQAYVIAGPAMTQLLGTASPRFSCVSVAGNKCKCCCTSYDQVHDVCTAS